MDSMTSRESEDFRIGLMGMYGPLIGNRMYRQRVKSEADAESERRRRKESEELLVSRRVGYPH